MKKQIPYLSDRLLAICKMVTVGNRVADVGCDHGFVSIYLVQNGLSPHVMAMDVRTGPLSRAEEHVKERNLSDYIEIRLSNGLAAYNLGEADTLICAGMGGRLMQRIILDAGDKINDFSELILQPQSDIPQFRRFIKSMGYEIVDEKIILEDGKYYFPMKAVKSGREISGCFGVLDDLFGGILLKNKDSLLKKYLESELSTLNDIYAGLASNENDRARNRLSEIEEMRENVKAALKLIL